MFKKIKGKMYKWAGSRSTKLKAEKLQTKLNHTEKVMAVIRVRKLGSPTALVPTVYEIWVRPTAFGKSIGLTLKSDRLETLIRVAQHQE